MTFALDSQAPGTIIVVTHRDFSYALSTLRMRGFRIVSIMPMETMPAQLADNVDLVISWEDVLKSPQQESSIPFAESEIKPPSSDPADDADTRPGPEVGYGHEFTKVNQTGSTLKFANRDQEPEDTIFAERCQSSASAPGLSSRSLHRSPQVASPISNSTMHE